MKRYSVEEMKQIKVGQLVYGMCSTRGGIPGEKWYNVGDIIPYVFEKFAGPFGEWGIHVRYQDKACGDHLVTLVNCTDQRGFYLSKFELLVKHKLGLL